MRRKSESPSSISLYMTCPKRYDFKYIKKLPDPSGPAAELGNLFHKAVYASWHTMSCEHPDRQISSMLQALYAHPDIAKLPHEKLVERVTCEYNVKTDMGGQEIYGFVDMLLDPIACAADVKTSGKEWNEQKIYEQMQHLAYTAALRKVGRSLVKRFFYLVVTTGKHPKCQVISLDVSDSVCDRYVSKFMNVVRMIELDLFMPTPSRSACGYCPYKNLCPAFADGAKPY